MFLAIIVGPFASAAEFRAPSSPSLALRERRFAAARWQGRATNAPANPTNTLMVRCEGSSGLQTAPCFRSFEARRLTRLAPQDEGGGLPLLSHSPIAELPPLPHSSIGRSDRLGRVLAFEHRVFEPCSVRRGARAKNACASVRCRRPFISNNREAHPSIFSAAMKASCGMSTLPNWRIFFLPSFCLSRSLRLRVMSPP